MNHVLARKCPKCGARLTAEQQDHQLSGQERLFCPQHGEVGTLRETTAHEYRDQRPDPDEFE
jgi:hypothetical protein